MNWQWRLAQYTEIRWWQKYLKNKGVESYLNQKKEYWNRILKILDLKIDPSMIILDAGCGPAGIFTILNNNKVIAFDPLLNEYASKLDHFNPKDYPNVNFSTKKLEDFQSHLFFDLVFLHECY